MTVPQGPIEPEKPPRKAEVTTRKAPDRRDAGWRWWYPVAAGVPIAAVSLYQAIPDFPFLWVCGLMLGAIAVVIGFWSRPASIGGDRG